MYGPTLSFSGRAVRTAQARLLLGLSFLLTVGGLQPVLGQTAESAITPVRLVPARPSGFYNWAHTGARIGGEFRTNDAALTENLRNYQAAMDWLSKNAKTESQVVEQRRGILLEYYVDAASTALKNINIIKGDLEMKLRESFALDRNRLDAQSLKVPGTETSLAQVFSRFSGPELNSALGLAHYVEKTDSARTSQHGGRRLLKDQVAKLFAVQAEMQSDLLTRKDGVGQQFESLESAMRGQLNQLAGLEKTGVELREIYRPTVGADEFHHRYPPARAQFDTYVKDVKRGFREARNRALATKGVGAPLVITVGALGFSAVANAGEAEAVLNKTEDVETSSFESRSWARPESRSRASRSVSQ